MDNTDHQQVMVLPLGTVKHQFKGLASMKVLFEPLFEDGKPECLGAQLGQEQKSLQVTATTFKANRLSKQGSGLLSNVVYARELSA